MVLATLATLLALVHAPSDSLSGRVRTADGTPIAGAMVSLPELNRQVLTDAQGAFRFVSLPAGQLVLVARAPGYAAVTSRVKAGDQVDLRLQPSATVEIADLVVTAAPGAIEGDRSPLANTVLGGRELASTRNVAIANATDELPGVRSLTTGGQIAKPIIRGLTGSRVLVMDQGHRLEDYSWSDEDGPSIDAALVGRVEVIRGPASVLYGSDALTGVVNALAPALPDAVGRQPEHGWRIGLGFASNNGDLNTLLRYDGARQNVGWRLTAIGRRAADIHTPDGELENTGYGAFNGEGAMTIRNSSGYLSLRAAHYGGEFKLLEANGPPPGTEEGEEEGPERKLADERVQADWLHAGQSWTWRAGAQYQRHSLIEVSDEVPGGGPGHEATAFDLLLNTISGRVSATRVWSSGVTATFGASGLLESNDTRGPIPLVPDADINSGSGSVVIEDRLGKVTVAAGARLDVRHLSAKANSTLGNPDDTRDYTAGSGTLGLVYEASPGFSLRSNLGLSWRAPNLFELYANGPHLGEARYERGDPTLTTERGVVFDLGARLDRSRVRLDASVYSQHIQDFIYITPTSEVIDGFQVYQHVSGTGELYGFEGEMDVDLSKSLTLRTRGDAVHATNTDTDEPLPLTPPLRGTLGLQAHHGRWLGVRNGTAEVDLVMVDQQHRPAALDVVTAGYALVNFDAGFDASLLHHELHVDLGIHNLANHSYRDFLSRYKTFALNPGRDFILRFDWAL